MRTITIISLILATVCITGFAQDKLTICWQKGNDFYTHKIYDSAAYYFEQIAAQKPHKADVYYNLGNTYYRLNKIGPSVLNYERALKINPDLKDAKDNLMLTQNRISNHIQPASEIFFIKWWNSLTHPVKATMWAITALIIFTLIIGALLFRKFNKVSGARLPVQAIYTLVFIWLCSIILSIISSNKVIKTTDGVVMQNDTPLMNNDLKGKPITQIPEGTTVSIIDDKEMWLEVRIPDGRIGWMQTTLVEKI